MTLRSLLTLQIAFLLAETSAPGRPAAVGIVVEAYRAHLGASAVSPGATVYDGDHFFTEEGGAPQLRCNAALLELAEKSAVLVRRVGNEAPDAKTEAELVEGTLVFSTRTGELEIQAREAHVRPAGNARTVAQVSVIGPKELHIYAQRGALLFSYRGESKTIAEGKSYEVILDPAEDGSGKKQTRKKSGQPPKAFLLVAAGAGAGAAAVFVCEEHKHKQNGKPGPSVRMTLQNRESNELEAGEEVADFEGGGLRSVRAVSAIVANAGAEVVADGAGSGFPWIGGTHGVAPLLDGAFGFEDEGEDFARAHKAAEFAKEWALFMDGIKASGLALSEDHRFDGHNAEAGLVNARENFTLKIARNGVWLDECESAFECHNDLLRKMK